MSIQLPEGLLEDMKLAAVEAGNNALAVKREGRKASEYKDDNSIVTLADTQGEEIIREKLAKYNLNIIGEEQGFTDNQSDWAVVIDPIDGTTNFDAGDPNWLVSIGVTYKGKPVAGVTYQPDLDKLYSAAKGEGAYLTERGSTQKLEIPKLSTDSKIIVDTLFARHPHYEKEGVLKARCFEDVPDLTQQLTGKKIDPKFRTTGCPSVPLCNLASGERHVVLAKPVKLWDVAASIVIAQEAGANIQFEPEDKNKTDYQSPYMILAAIPELFDPLKNIVEKTITNRAQVYNSAANPDALEAIKQDLVYGISAGRRQPMHKVHVDCIKEIKSAGLKPVIVIGSADSAESPYFDPIKNPLTEAQQREQIGLAMQQAGITDYQVIAQKDKGSAQHWTSSLRWNLLENGVDIDCAAMHFRSKSQDEESMDKTIRPLSAYQETLTDYGLSVWQSTNADPEFDNISASPFRKMDLESEEFESNKSTLATPDYIANLAKEARQANPDSALLEGVPITMLDLSLERMCKELGINTSQIVQAVTDDVVSVETLTNAIQDILEKRQVKQEPVALLAENEQVANSSTLQQQPGKLRQ